MTMKQTLDIYELLDGAGVDGKEIKAMFAPFAAQGVEVTVTTVANEEDATRTTDFIRILIPGRNGATSRADWPLRCDGRPPSPDWPGVRRRRCVGRARLRAQTVPHEGKGRRHRRRRLGDHAFVA